MKNKNILPLAVALLTATSFAHAATIDIAGSLGTSGGEFADYSLLDQGDAFGPSSDTDGTVTLSVGTDGAPYWITGNYPGAGSEINFSQGVGSLTNTAAFSDGQYLNFDFSSTTAINLDSLSVSLWRNGGGAPNNFQFAVNSGNVAWETTDLLGSVTTNTDSGTTGAFTITLASTLPTNFTSETVRLYFWDDDGNANGNGNTHLYNVTADYSAVPEPGTFALLAGLCAFGFITLRRRK